MASGIGKWHWASNDRDADPDVVMACCGDVPTLETLAAVSILREHFPELKVLFDPTTGRVLGTQAVGGAGVDKRIDVLAVAIQAGMSVFDLEEMELAYAPQYGSAKDPINMAGFVAGGLLRGDHPQVDVEAAFTAAFLILAIVVHLVLRFVFHATPGTLQIPLLITLGVGGLPLIYDLLIKLWKRESEVRYPADQVGITEIYAQKRPEEKLAIVRQETIKAKTLYVGDGINDAHAMMAATVGMAIGQKSDVTAEAAGVVIMDKFTHQSRRVHAH